MAKFQPDWFTGYRLSAKYVRVRSTWPDFNFEKKKCILGGVFPATKDIFLLLKSKFKQFKL